LGALSSQDCAGDRRSTLRVDPGEPFFVDGSRMTMQDDRRERQDRAARNQALFREVNERIEDINERFETLTSRSDWVCECAAVECTERLEMSCREYEAIRSVGDRFIVAPGDEHVWPDVERVVERHQKYWVVEKIEHAAKVARATDPRSDDDPLSLRT
jgi:hypothetical protein